MAQHTERSRIRVGAAVLVGGAVAAAAARAALIALTAVAGPVRDGGASALADVGLDVALAGGCSLVVLGALLWLAATTLVAAAAVLAGELAPGSRTARRFRRVSEQHCPPTVRRLVAVVLGTALGVGVGAVPALAVGHGDAPRSGDALSVLLTGLAVPHRTTGGSRAAIAPRTTVDPVPAPARQPPTGTVLVRPGDSLWRIAARALPPGADDAAVTAAWHRLHETNRTRTSPDPDLLLPGTRLTIPSDLGRTPIQPPREELR